MNGLRMALAEFLITDLTASPDLTLVERTRLNEVMGELDLQQSPWADPASAARLGRGLGAQLLLAGSYLVEGGKIRVDTRLIDVETAEVLLAVSEQGVQTDFLALERRLAEQLIERVGGSLSILGKKRIGSGGTGQLEAINHYGLGLDALDAGDIARATAELRSAIKQDKDFSRAAAILDGLQEQVDTAKKNRVASIDSAPAEILALAKDVADSKADLGALPALLKPIGGLSYEETIVRCPSIQPAMAAVLALNKPIPGTVEEFTNGGSESPALGFVFDRQVFCAWELGLHEDAAQWGTEFLKRFPHSGYRAEIERLVKAAMWNLTVDKKKAGRIDKIAGYVNAKGLHTTCVSPANHYHKCDYHKRWPVTYVQRQACRELALMPREVRCPYPEWTDAGPQHCQELNLRFYETWIDAIEDAQFPYASGRWELEEAAEILHAELQEILASRGEKIPSHQQVFDPKNPTVLRAVEMVRAGEKGRLHVVQKALAKSRQAYSSDRWRRCGGRGRGRGSNNRSNNKCKDLPWDQPKREPPKPSKSRSETAQAAIQEAWKWIQLGRLDRAEQHLSRHIGHVEHTFRIRRLLIEVALKRGDIKTADEHLSAWAAVKAGGKMGIRPEAVKARRKEFRDVASWMAGMPMDDATSMADALSREGLHKRAGAVIEAFLGKSEDLSPQTQAFLLFKAAENYHKGRWTRERDAMLIRVIQDYPKSSQAGQATSWAARLATQPLANLAD
jgi:TolB-like protein